MTAVVTEAARSATPPLPASMTRSGFMPRRRLRPLRLAVCILLGLAATFGVNYATARMMPFVRPGASAVGTGSENWLDRATDRFQRVEVAVWGDHLKPWHMRLSTPWSTRLLWFEKGRVYGSTRGNPQASSAAVSSWSFAAQCWQAVGSAVTGPLPDPPALSETNRQ
ncbi:MAG TPA: hypothetical protein VFF65_05580, partial [Phycisphaerales bacterium]|nr:hypothetical protein [Phycisphaerales bacterium]